MKKPTLRHAFTFGPALWLATACSSDPTREPVEVAPERAVVETSRIPPVFRQLLANTLLTGVTSSFLWFALTFWVYLETHSVVATGIIGGAFSIASAVLGPVFGTFVDRHRKHTATVHRRFSTHGTYPPTPRHIGAICTAA